MTSAAHELPESGVATESLPRLSHAITQLKLTNFRSYNSLKVNVPGASVALIGPNGSGKTNVLEAISWLAPGRGLRRATLVDAYAHSKAEAGSPEGWAVNATVSSGGLVTKLGSGIVMKDNEGGQPNFRRVASIDGTYVRSIAQLNQHLTVQWVTPQMDRILADGLTERRQFLDRLIYAYDPQHASRIAQYEIAVRERMKLLKYGRTDNVWISSLEQKLSSLSLALVIARMEFVRRLQEMNCWQMTSFPRPILSMEGELETLVAEGDSATVIESWLCDVLYESRQIDARTGITHHGAHRSNLRVFHAEKNMPANQSSTGEQKAMLLSIVIANTRLLMNHNKPSPVLLFDEVIAHLDAQRRSELFTEIDQLGVQVWMTGTDASVFESANCMAHFVTTGAT